ncbi:MAG: ketoacyl-ACP synthase III [Lachnospiraceae bacterium]|nr:ketoacyl-ACP synthase III [Lachnospiraceae bacterium]
MEYDYGIGILGVGKYLPNNVIDNNTIAEWAKIEPNVIAEKLGINTRRLAACDEKASDMATKAAMDALNNAQIDVDKLGLILGCNYSADYHFPAMACKIQANLKAWNAGAYDLLANCTSFQVGIANASEKMYFDNGLDYSLVIGTALQSRYIDWKDANTSMYCGDGAGAAVLGKVPKGYGVLSNEIISNGRVYEAARLRGGGSSHIINKDNIDDNLGYFEMNGLEVWKQVVQWQPKVIKKSLEKAGLSIADVDYFIFHQANYNLIQYLMGKMKVDIKKTYVTVDKYGNTADASLPITLCEAVENKKIKRNDIVVISGVGAGFIFGSTVMRWY